MKLLLAGCAIVTLVAAAVVPSPGADRTFAAWDAGPGAIDVSSYPEEQRQNYALFASKCSTCHSLARPINAQLSATRWKRYMKRAMRRAGSSIGEAEAARICEFLEYHGQARGTPSPAAPARGGAEYHSALLEP